MPPHPGTGSLLRSPKERKILWRHEQFDGSRGTWRPADEAFLLELANHAVNRWRSHFEEALHVGFCWGGVG